LADQVVQTPLLKYDLPGAKTGDDQEKSGYNRAY
jgi:hypothetical protein